MTAIIGWASPKELPLDIAVNGLHKIEHTAHHNKQRSMQSASGESTKSLTMLNGSDWLHAGTTQNKQSQVKWLQAQQLPKQKTNVLLASSTRYWPGSKDARTSYLLQYNNSIFIAGTVGYITQLCKDHGFSSEINSGYPQKLTHWIAKESHQNSIHKTLETISRLPYSLFLALFLFTKDNNKLFLVRSQEHSSRKPSPYLFYDINHNGRIIFASTEQSLKIANPKAIPQPVSEKSVLTFNLPPLSYPTTSSPPSPAT